MKSTNTIWHEASVTREKRESLNGHRGVVIWFTGLSGSGKSTLAHAVEMQLHQMECRTLVLDGDNVRHGLCGDLGFSDPDRKENIRRVGEVSKLFVDAGIIVLTAFISPFRIDRESVRDLLSKRDFIEVYCQCPVSKCEDRDVKGLYKKAREGVIKDFTGISSPYETPLNAELTLDTETHSIDVSVSRVLDFLESVGIIDARSKKIY
jgi:adenylylsulfate kinase